MVRGKETKNAALMLTATCITVYVLSALGGFPVEKVGICKDCSVLARLAYSFFHASLLHALINCWCLLSIAFVYDLPINRLFVAYIIAVTFPVNTIGSVFGGLPVEVPTVGLSAVCFALLGMASFQVRRKLYYHSFLLSFIALGFLIPLLGARYGLPVASPNNILHLYCYVAGLLVGFLNSPAHEEK